MASVGIPNFIFIQDYTMDTRRWYFLYNQPYNFLGVKQNLQSITGLSPLEGDWSQHS